MPTTEFKHDVFQAIADPTRRGILLLLKDKEMSIASMTECFPITRTAVNKHLHILYEAGLVTSHKKGRETRFSLRPEPLAAVKDWLTVFEEFWGGKLLALRQYIESDNE